MNILCLCVAGVIFIRFEVETGQLPLVYYGFVLVSSGCGVNVPVKQGGSYSRVCS
jgi:hypothetical protein